MKKLVLVFITCLVLVACSDEKAETKKLKSTEESAKTENLNAAEETQNTENASSTEVSQNSENNSSTEETEYIAEVSYFKEIVLRNDEGQFISFDPDGAYIVASYSLGNKTDLDTVIEKDSHKGGILQKNYKDITIEAEGSMYYIKLTEEITLQFERIGERIFKDSLGIRYYAENKQ